MFCRHLIFFPRFGILYQEKSGNPRFESSSSYPKSGQNIGQYFKGTEKSASTVPTSGEEDWFGGRERDRYRVARWYIFIPKIEIPVYLWAHRNGIVGKFYGHFEYFMAIWRISFSFGIICGYYICIFSPFWYGALRKNWQTWTNRCKNRETERRRWIQCCQANFPSIKQWRIGACSTREGLWGQCNIHMYSI
jgi:hypothetical protein